MDRSLDENLRALLGTAPIRLGALNRAAGRPDVLWRKER